MKCDTLVGSERELQQKRDAWRQIAAACPAIPCDLILAECTRNSSLEPLEAALRELDAKLGTFRDQRGLLVGEVRFVRCSVLVHTTSTVVLIGFNECTALFTNVQGTQLYCVNIKYTVK